MINRSELNTEKQNKKSNNIDSMSILNILSTINEEDHTISFAVKKAIPSIEKAVKFSLESISTGGRVFYIGAGTSGRLGVLDASEIPPTFSVEKNKFIGLIAGGDKALTISIEGAEDNRETIIKELKSYKLNKKDTLIGISCSGAAAYVVSGLEYANKTGSKTVYLVTNPKPYFMTDVDTIIHVDTGAEIVTGSTRMKAGTATKMVLNMISTATMIKLGKVYGNLMVDLMAINKKLMDRGTRIVSQVTGSDYINSKKILLKANRSVKSAIVMQYLDCSLGEAEKEIEKSNGYLSKIIKLKK